MRVRLAPGSFAWITRSAPGVGSMRKISSSGSGVYGVIANFGGRLKMTRISVARTGSALPARMKNGTPDQRQLSISSRNAANGGKAAIRTARDDPQNAVSYAALILPSGGSARARSIDRARSRTHPT